MAEIQSYVTDGVRKPISVRRVKAISRRFRRAKGKLRAQALAASTWKPRLSEHLVYRERLPDGKQWSGLSTHTHRYQGEELELLRLVMQEERASLYSYKN